MIKKMILVGLLIMMVFTCIWRITPTQSFAVAPNNTQYDGVWKSWSVTRISWNDRSYIPDAKIVNADMTIENGIITSLTYSYTMSGQKITEDKRPVANGTLIFSTYTPFGPTSPTTGSYHNLIIGELDNDNKTTFNNINNKNEGLTYAEFTSNTEVLIYVLFSYPCDGTIGIHFSRTGNLPKTDGVESKPAPGSNDSINATASTNSVWENILPEKDKALADTLYCLNDMAWNGKNYVLVGRGRILTSSNGVNWKVVHTSGDDHVLNAVVWNGKEFVAVGTVETDNTTMIMKSKDGTTWNVTNPGIKGSLRDIVWNGTIYTAVGTSGVVITSADGIKWSSANVSVHSDFSKIIWANGQFLAVGKNIIVSSINGTYWSVLSNQAGDFKGVAYYKNQYLVFEIKGKILITKDLKKWDYKQVNAPNGQENPGIVNVAYGKDLLQIAWTDKSVYSSTDLLNWKSDSLTKGSGFNNILVANGNFFIVGPQTIYLSTSPVQDAVSDTPAPSQAAIRVISNNKELITTQSPYMSGSVPMLSAKVTLEASGAIVAVSGSKLTITRGTKKVVLTVNSNTVVLNGKSTILEAKVTTQSNVVFAPLKKIVEALGGTYVWDAEKKIVTIKMGVV